MVMTEAKRAGRSTPRFLYGHLDYRCDCQFPAPLPHGASRGDLDFRQHLRLLPEPYLQALVALESLWATHIYSELKHIEVEIVNLPLSITVLGVAQTPCTVSK